MQAAPRWGPTVRAWSLLVINAATKPFAALTSGHTNSACSAALPQRGSAQTLMVPNPMNDPSFTSAQRDAIEARAPLICYQSGVGGGSIVAGIQSQTAGH